jgi:GT2 family glycosyltransferase
LKDISVSLRVTVVIPNWNGETVLNRCLTSLRGQSFGDFETILVDNGSADASVDFTARNFPEVRVISLDDNRGFSAAVTSQAESRLILTVSSPPNQGFVYAPTPMVRTPDNDCRVIPLTLAGTHTLVVKH